MRPIAETIDGAEGLWRWEGFLPRSYLFSLERVEPEPAGLQPVHLPRGHLFVSPDYQCHVESAGSSSLILIGHCIDLRAPNETEADIARSLLHRVTQRGVDAMLAQTDDLFGRFAVICLADGGCQVFGDACATRTIYFAEDRPVIASHSTLLGGLIGAAPRVELFSHYWCALPGNASPTEGVRILPANFVLDLGDRTLRRFWPRSDRTERPVADLIDEAHALMRAAAVATAARWKPALSLTAGLDSRLSLSVYRGIPELMTFTYDRGEQDKADAEGASRLSERLRIPHRRLHPVDGKRAESAHAVMERLADCPIDKFIGPICFSGFAGESDVIHVRSSLAEIGRSFWRRHPRMPTTLDPLNWTLVSMTSPTAGRPDRPQAAAYMRDEMRRFFATVGYDSADPRAPEIMGYDIWDLVYIEHRMSTWHGPTLLAYDMAFDTSILFNCRRIVELMLAAPAVDRRKATLFRAIIQRCCPEVADIPINPRPRRTLGQLAYGAYRQLRRRAGFLRAMEARLTH